MDQGLDIFAEALSATPVSWDMRIVHKSKRSVPLVRTSFFDIHSTTHTLTSQAQPVADLVSRLADTANEDLPQVLAEIDVWKWPRSDLNAWIKVLDKFDSIMEEIIRDYEVDKLQRVPFSQFHKKLLSVILRLERLLLENSTNRKTYNSYDVSTFWR